MKQLNLWPKFQIKNPHFVVYCLLVHDNLNDSDGFWASVMLIFEVCHSYVFSYSDYFMLYCEKYFIWKLEAHFVKNLNFVRIKKGYMTIDSLAYWYNIVKFLVNPKTGGQTVNWGMYDTIKSWITYNYLTFVEIFTSQILCM